MAIEVKIPLISEGVDTAEVIEVLVSEGDSIKEEQSIIALETDKASVEVPSSHSGVIKEIKVSVGDEVKVGDVILILDDEGGEEEGKENGDDDSGETEQKKDKKENDKDSESGKNTKREKAEKTGDSEEESSEGEGRNEPKRDEKAGENSETKEEEMEASDVPASPSVRRLARESGVDIKRIKGSGPGGRITEQDVKSQSKQAGKEGEDKKSTAVDLPDFSKWGAVQREALSNIRKTTAKNTLTSWQSIPHVFQFDEADISGITQYMDENKSKTENAGGKLTITAILVKVMASALQQFPQFNASIDMENEEVILKKYFHIGVAVDTDKGLLVPVIRDVEKKTIVELAVEISELAEKTRQGKLSPEEMQGGNITISNLGGIGGTQFTPIVYSPQVAILGVSRAKEQAVYLDGSFEPRQILPLSLSYDHRLIDGADGARFLRWICQALEDPYRALLGA
ncbi:2-oxo acid dehydrogenase subunit E2 [Algoriphagus sp. NG3]|uniref:2-oxo acid dehydrogenase subunit E2 n=1 Tax=Algoriphagus sp. NG3 TaxID=3097546 RepID=UPI002A8213AE|nr:2-oxo acid dehydrogenase subunit E2 [Algoriphagus sp. NG3]WPR75957.1 2-oxo acid dehydrogenase subunit E2 [Algoriphagus sp. NG3]